MKHPNSPLNADNTATSQAVITAINELANYRDAVAWRIWLEPTPMEIMLIIDKLEKANAQYPEDYFWGAADAGWAIGTKGSAFYENEAKAH